MCGIVGCVGDVDVVERLIAGLNHLEYRGYDSAGIAVGPRDLSVYKRAGEVRALRDSMEGVAQGGSVGIGHTRWSTHGSPTDENAHPHTDCTDGVAVVHNGVIENYDELRSELTGRGHEFTSDTDTEVVPHLLEEELAAGRTPREALRRAVDRLEGSYAVAAVVEGSETIYAARNDSPLVIGVDDGVRYLASDVPAFLDHTDRVAYLEDGDVAVLTPGNHRILDEAGRDVDRMTRVVDWVPEETRKQDHDHFMKKEIYEQPEAVARALEGRIGEDGTVQLDDLPPEFLDGVTNVQFVACGTSYHASKYCSNLLIERGIRAHARLASEYATAPSPIDEGTLVVGVTQSGETADTLAALRAARDDGARTLAVTNVTGSTADRECDETVYIRAGPEIGVAATKTFSSQVTVLALLVELLAGRDEETRDRLEALSELPRHLTAVLDSSTAAATIRNYVDSEAFFFIGRGVAHPVALEGALKLKEISYEHAEGFPAGELKHGPLALVTPDTPVIATLTGTDEEETLTNAEEVSARNAPVIVVTDREEVGVADDVVSVPSTHPHVAPILANVQLQLLSYHLAALLDRPIDKPRNLAKSVTVK